jgi:hypothetical protein
MNWGLMATEMPERNDGPKSEIGEQILLVDGSSFVLFFGVDTAGNVHLNTSLCLRHTLRALGMATDMVAEQFSKPRTLVTLTPCRYHGCSTPVFNDG